jgi:hypothetical protein
VTSNSESITDINLLHIAAASGPGKVTSMDFPRSLVLADDRPEPLNWYCAGGRKLPTSGTFPLEVTTSAGLFTWQEVCDLYMYVEARLHL